LSCRWIAVLEGLEFVFPDPDVQTSYGYWVMKVKRIEFD
jgi:hypothetical protein